MTYNQWSKKAFEQWFNSQDPTSYGETKNAWQPACEYKDVQPLIDKARADGFLAGQLAMRERATNKVDGYIAPYTINNQVSYAQREIRTLEPEVEK